MATKIYEVVDATDEATYYPIGVFLTLKDALDAIRNTENPWELCENAMFHGEAATIEIRERLAGLKPNDAGTVVWKTEWGNEYNDGGSACVDWPFMFDRCARHALAPSSAIREVDFTTANPGVSSRWHWLATT